MARQNKKSEEQVLAQTPEQPETKQEKLIVMFKGEKKAEVHPLEVDNFKLGGYQIK